MKKLILISMFVSSILYSKDFELEFNNKIIDIKLDEPTILKLNEKESINIKFREKNEQTFNSQKYTFKYKKDNPPIVRKLSEELTQVVMLNDKSNQIIIQEYNFKIEKNLIYENILSTLKKDTSTDLKNLQTIVSKEIKGQYFLGDSFIISENNIKTKYVFYYKELSDSTIIIIETTIFNEKEPDEKSKGINYNLFWRTFSFN